MCKTKCLEPEVDQTLRRKIVTKKPLLTLLLFTTTGMSSFHCGVTQPVRVVDKGETQISASLGGPFVQTGTATIPVPYLNVGIIHGSTGDVTLTGNVHLLPLVFGDAGIDAGAAVRVVRQDGPIPELTVKGQLTYFVGFTGAAQGRLYPEGSFNASYAVGESSLVYSGADNWFQSSTPSFLFTPFLGYQFPLGRRWKGQLETKWMAANINTSRGIFEGHGNIANHGNTSMFLAVLYTF